MDTVSTYVEHLFPSYQVCSNSLISKVSFIFFRKAQPRLVNKATVVVNENHKTVTVAHCKAIKKLSEYEEPV